jgi:hypothetical protein
MNKKSPINFFGSIGAAAGLGSSGRSGISLTDIPGMMMAGNIFGGKKSIKKRVKKVENQVNDLLRDKYSNKEPEYNTTVGDNPSQQTPYDSFEGPEPYQGGTVDITGNSQVGGPNAAVAGQQMFGEQMPGSFDRDMGM